MAGEDAESLVCHKLPSGVLAQLHKESVSPAPETKFELPCRVALLSLMGPCVRAAWFIYLPAWLLKALEFLASLGVLRELV